MRGCGRARRMGAHLVSLAMVVVVVFPVLWALSASFKPPPELYDLAPVPAHPTVGNYRVALGDLPLAHLLLNTVVVSIAVTAVQVLVSVLAAYAFAVLDMRHRRGVFAAVIATILIPQQCLMIPNYVLATRLGWLNTYLGLVIPLTATCAFGVLLLRQHLAAVPPSLIEAARMEGAHDAELLRQVVVPVVRPAINALAVLVFVTTWNEYLWPLLIAPGRGSTTVQVGLQMFQTQEGSEYGPMMAAATLATVPVLLAYLANQRRVTDAFIQAGIR